VRFTGDNLDDLDVVWAQFVSVCDYVGITLGDHKTPAWRPTYTFLGMWFDHSRKCVRITQKLSDKILLWSRKLSDDGMTILDALILFGLCIFASKVTNYPLARAYYIFKFMRRIAKKFANSGSHALDSTIFPWPCIVRPWVDWANDVRTKEYSPCRIRPQTTASLWTDASTSGWGMYYVSNNKITTTGCSWTPAERRLHINEKELLATLQSLKFLERKELLAPAIHVYIDNTSAKSWLDKKRARAYVANALALEIAECRCVVGTTWVCSAAQLADPFSRIYDKPSRDMKERLPIAKEKTTASASGNGDGEQRDSAAEAGHLLKQACCAKATSTSTTSAGQHS